MDSTLAIASEHGARHRTVDVEKILNGVPGLFDLAPQAIVVYPPCFPLVLLPELHHCNEAARCDLPLYAVALVAEAEAMVHLTNALTLVPNLVCVVPKKANLAVGAHARGGRFCSAGTV